MFWRWPEPTVLRVGVRRSLFMILVLSTYMCCVMFAIRREVWSYGPGRGEMYEHPYGFRYGSTEEQVSRSSILRYCRLLMNPQSRK